MLFNSYPFVFVFLPVVWLGFHALARASQRSAALWLVAASVFFYGYWNPRFVALLLASITFNYLMGLAIARAPDRSSSRRRLTLALIVDLGLLAWFKYTNFFIVSLDAAFGLHWSVADIVLPLGISFFTFTQIAFLVDVHRAEAREYDFVHYLLFVTYFPHLIAGPILHHRQMMPQFAAASTYRFDHDNAAAGLTAFILGLAKKVLIADTLSTYANPVFAAASQGSAPMLFEAWLGAIAYTLQIYFDFSGYSDMAIGLSLLFNVRLPLNFNSPYQSTSIIEFWRRWHMTLSAFLRDYLYISLGGNRRGRLRRYLNLMTTMLLGGLWHGAGWTFVGWGALHGFYLMVNHGWRELRQRLGVTGPANAAGRLAGGILTFFAVVLAWVVFRADSFASARRVLTGMAGSNGVSLPVEFEALLGGGLPKSTVFIGLQPLTGLTFNQSAVCCLTIVLGLGLAILAPNVHQLLRRYRPVCDETQAVTDAARIEWRPTSTMATLMGALLFVTLLWMKSRHISEFIYFQF